MRRLRIAAACLLGALYGWCLAPSVHVHDAGELTAAAWTLGVGHPPGAPLYMLLSKAFLVLVPLGSIAWRANLFSAAAAVCAVLVFDALARKLTGRPGLALAGSCAVGLSLTFWYQAEMAEVYTLQALLLLAFLWACAGAVEGRRTPTAAFLWGLLLACHAGLSPLTPAVLVLLALPGEGGARAWFRRAVGLVPPLVLPLLLYAYVPLRSLRDPFVDWGNPETPAALWWHLTNRQVRGRMLSLSPHEYLHRAADYLGILAANLHILLPLALVGLAVGWRRDRSLALLLALVCAADAGFVVLMDTAPLASEAYAIPSVACLALLAVWGASAFRGPILARAGTVVVGAAAVLSLGVNLPTDDLHRNFLVRDAAESLLAQTPQGATLFVQEDSTTNALVYLCGVEGARRDLEVFDRLGNLFGPLYDRPLFAVPGSERPAYRSSVEGPAVASRLERGRPVAFSTPFLEYAPERFTLTAGAFATRACLPGTPCPPPVSPIFPRPRAGNHPDWMSRQILAELACRSAAAALAAGRPEDARRAVGEALSWADLPELFLLAGQEARKAGDSQLALKSAEEALARRPDFAPALSLKGALLLESGRAQDAAGTLEAASHQGAVLPQNDALLGQMAAARGDWNGAIEAFGRALEARPDQPDILHDRALVLLKLHRPDAAETDLRAALTLRPGHRPARVQLVRLLLERGRKPEARDALCGACLAGAAAAWPAPELKDLLLLSAQAGFPPCVAEWLQKSDLSSKEVRALAEAYFGAEDQVRRPQQR